MRTITARQKVLAFLRRRKAATAGQIGHALYMSAATVRHHLSLLTADGRVVAEGIEAKGRRGRPQKVYRISERLRGDNLGFLAGAALEAWLGKSSGAGRESAMRGLAARLSEQMGRVAGSGPKRLVELTEKLSALHYEAGWEAGAEGPRVLLGHCPYAGIIARHPELCRMDALMLGMQMDAEAVQVSKIDPAATSPTHCVFALRGRGGR